MAPVMEIISMFCPFCQEYTSLTPGTMEVSTGRETLTVRALCQIGVNDQWWIGICNHCRSPVLVHNKGDIIYPNPLPSPTDERIPDPIKQDLNEAKICFSANAYRACAVMAHRAMQSACIQKGAKKENLIDQSLELTNNGIITKDLKEWAVVHAIYMGNS